MSGNSTEVDPTDTVSSVSRQSGESDIASARETIRSERLNQTDNQPSEQSGKWKSFKESFVTASTIITVLVAVGGLLFTMYQFDKTMQAQRHANAEAAIGQFISQVTELRTQESMSLANSTNANITEVTQSDLDCSENNAQRHSLLDSFIVTRAQMLIDGEETGRFAGDIIRFLTANQYGHYIGVKPCGPGQSIEGPRVTVEGIVLVDSKLANSKVEGVFLKCMGFEQGTFDSINFTNSFFQNMVINESEIFSVDFTNTWLGSISFIDTDFKGYNNFDNATLYGVSLVRSKLDNASFSFNGARILHSDFSRIAPANATNDNFYEQFALQLSGAKSLWGTKLPEPVIFHLKKELTIAQYKAKLETPDQNFLNASVELDWVWDKHCPPQERRDRRLNAPANQSSGLLQALF